MLGRVLFFFFFFFISFFSSSYSSSCSFYSFLFFSSYSSLSFAAFLFLSSLWAARSQDGRRLYCRLLFLDSHLNLVIADCEESFLPANCVSNSAEERRRKLEIANLRWEHVQSIHAHPDLIADVEMQIKNTLSEHHKA
eukprot:GHVT01067551.1.p1 GENE.GHVT01067551.1~~GHVT01067551.1.p1  ORF type:complete len:138 (+),score=27.55 GHVT01067551.1:316-729(+)